MRLCNYYQLPKNTSSETPQPMWRPKPYIHGKSELIARHLRQYNLTIAHKPKESLRKALAHVKGPLPMPRWRIVVYSIPCSECPSTYVGQTGRPFATPMRKHQSAVRRQDGNFFLVLHCLTTGHAFDCTRASVVGNGSTKRTREFIEAWKTPPKCVNHCTTIGPCYEAL